MKRLIVMLLLLLVWSLAFAQDNVLIDLLGSLLGSGEIMTPLIVFLLSLIPGPFRGIVKALVSWLLERAKGELERRRHSVAEGAVLAVEQLKKTGRVKDNQDALNTAASEVASSLNVDMGEAKRLVEAEVGRMNATQPGEMTEDEKQIHARLDELEESLKSAY
jgi:hypothetical protein